MPTLSSFSAINYNLHVSVKILGGFLHVWNFSISVPLLQMSRIWSRRDMPRWAETTSAKAARGEVVRGPGSARWVKVEEVDGDGKKVTLGVGTKDMQMRSWRWEKAPTLSGEACTAAQRRLAEKEKMGLQRVQISATNVSFWMSIDAHFIYSVARTTTQVFAGFFRHRCTFREGTWWHEWILPLKGREGLWLQRQYY